MFLLVDKPKGITSHDVVDKIREIAGEKKVGHAGTLDPNATGLLIVGVGRKATKNLGKIIKHKKTYEAEIFLGEERNTDDVEGFVASKAKGFLAPSEKEVRLILTSFLGKQKQKPPAFSAIKIKGKKAYELARKGIKVDLELRDIIIYHLKLVSFKYPILLIEATVSSGTYIRALARDIGQRLGCGAYLKELRRTKIGNYSLESATLLKNVTRKNWKSLLIDIG